VRRCRKTDATAISSSFDAGDRALAATVLEIGAGPVGGSTGNLMLIPRERKRE